ncbi:MAG TPA: DUF3127 domain-containing protein [Chitinophagales bacterium]|jgi:hypothetical protein|nr:DUF3127 domain-containing protein [Chitinophagales bacterium]
MEVSGKIFKVLPLVTGEGRNGKWQKQELVLEMDSGKYPKKVLVSVWGDLVTNNTFQEGSDISLEVDIESREYNGRWYTDVKAWRVNRANGGGNRPAQAPSYNDAPPAHSASDAPAPTIEDDLPF